MPNVQTSSTTCEKFRLRKRLGEHHGSRDSNIAAFQTFPMVLGRLLQLQAAFKRSPSTGFALEFGVFTGGSLRNLAVGNKNSRFIDFDSFKGLPEAWYRSETSIYPAGHFKLKSLPLMPSNVSLIEGFIEDTLPPWLEKNPGKVSFVHIDVDLYSTAKFVLMALSDRLEEGAVIVFDELCDWKEQGIYPLWREGEWKALQEWLEANGFCYRILSRGERFEAAIQVYRGKPAPRNSSAELQHASDLWDCGLQNEAIDLLAAVVSSKPQWMGGSHRLVTWLTKMRNSLEALALIEKMQPLALATPEHTHAIDLYKLSAENYFRLGELDAAWEQISLFREKRPSHVGGLSLYARIAGRRRDHEASAQAWGLAYSLSGIGEYRQNEEDEKVLSEIKPAFRSMKFSGLMIQHLIEKRDFSTVLDIGSGSGEQAAALRAHGKIVTELDYGESYYFKKNAAENGVIIGDFLKIDFHQVYSCVIASHILEHQLNVNVFLKKIHSVLQEGGLIGISVPPMKPNIVGGHVTLWNAGLVLYNLVLAGFDCREPWIRAYGYNISVVLVKKTISPQGLAYDGGDIDRIAQYLPDGFREGFDGNIRSFG